MGIKYLQFAREKQEIDISCFHYLQTYFLQQPLSAWRDCIPQVPPRAAMLLPGANSSIGNAIRLNASQGELLSRGAHSLSGTLNSVALTRYCSGRSIRITEKKPRDTARKRLPLSHISPIPLLTWSGISPQTQQHTHEHSEGSTTRVPSITGSTVSTTAMGKLLPASPHTGTLQKLSPPGVERKTCTEPSPP